jgi:hypothetical protein
LGRFLLHGQKAKFEYVQGYRFRKNSAWLSLLDAPQNDLENDLQQASCSAWLSLLDAVQKAILKNNLQQINLPGKTPVRFHTTKLEKHAIPQTHGNHPTYWYESNKSAMGSGHEYCIHP